ncbi:hypothetical protein X961_5939 [Burkholderia pseudomallei MSHR5613]|nr:hypothetical protein X961_5939 [Burkholderia pseudomallei MSHR5613]KGX50558.1 hypothetical protein Y024_5917 [Burkholderia pseudomallei TSV44]
MVSRVNVVNICFVQHDEGIRRHAANEVRYGIRFQVRSHWIMRIVDDHDSCTCARGCREASKIVPIVVDPDKQLLRADRPQ